MVSQAEQNRLINAELVLKLQEGSLQRSINAAKKNEAKEKKVLLKLMKGGEEDLIDDQAVLLASIQGQIKEMTKKKNNLHRFTQKVSMARQQKSIGESMLAVSQALGSVTKDLQLERVEQIMSDLASKYDDIDVMTSVMDTATTKATAKQVPQEEVDRIKRQIADEAGLELSAELNSTEPVKAAPVDTTQVDERQLEETLKALRLQSAA